jgi:hypothetical protein
MNGTPDMYADIKKEPLPFEIWEQLPGETGRAYAAFRASRDYGPERNIRKAVEAECNKQSGGYDRSKIEKRYRTRRLRSMQFK